MIRFTAAWLFGLASVLALAGCGDKSKPSQQDEFKNKKDEHGHDHSDHSGGEADATLPNGKKCHAVLSPHLSPEGNEIDVSFESFDKEPKPLTIPEKTKLTARVVRKGDDKPYTLTFAPAEMDERKGDPPGQCSRFSAKAPWLKPDDTLASVTLTIEGAAETPVWTDFEVKKHAHEHK
jgi:hypothetical protein